MKHVTLHQSIGWKAGSLLVALVVLPALALFLERRPTRQTDALYRTRSHREPRTEPTVLASRENASDPLAQVMSALKSQPDRQTRLLAAYTNWQKNQPELAWKLITLLNDRLCGTANVLKAELEWSEEELQQGIAQILDLEKTDEILPIFSELAGRLIIINPAEAFAALQNFPGTGPEKEEILTDMTAKWALVDPERALQWVREEPSESARDTMLQRIVQCLVQIDPARAAAIVATDFDSPEAEANSARTVVGRWTLVNPTATADWLCCFPATELRREMLQVMITTWASQDQPALIHWIEALPADKFRLEVESVYRHQDDTAVAQTMFPPH